MKIKLEKNHTLPSGRVLKKGREVEVTNDLARELGYLKTMLPRTEEKNIDNRIKKK